MNEKTEKLIDKKGVRLDGRKADELRPVTSLILARIFSTLYLFTIAAVLSDRSMAPDAGMAASSTARSSPSSGSPLGLSRRDINASAHPCSSRFNRASLIAMLDMSMLWSREMSA